MQHAPHLGNIVTASKKLNILLVDDSMTILTRMKEMLADVKCIGILNHATNASEAYEIIKADQPELVLLDINMPGKNGIELLKEVKQFYPSVKVMMVTNQAVDYYKPICENLGAEYFIDKSTEFEMIPEIIQDISRNIDR